MKIKVKTGRNGEEKKRVRRIYLVLPNSMLKSRLAAKIIREGAKRREEDGKPAVVSFDCVTRELLKTLYKSLKTVIKQNGHFNLVEVEAADGTKVLIRI